LNEGWWFGVWVLEVVEAEWNGAGCIDSKCVDGEGVWVGEVMGSGAKWYVMEWWGGRGGGSER
jgi:hypothetical protein